MWGPSVSITVSVVVPSFNRRQWLARTLPTYQVVRGVREVIIVDDGSGDGTAELVESAAKQDARVKLVRHSRNKGVAAARNSGLEAATSEFVCYGEDEAFFEPDYVEVLGRHLEEHRADIIAGPRAMIESYESRRDDLRRYVDSLTKRIPWSLDYPFAVPTDVDLEWPFLSPCALIRRSVGEKVKYDPGYLGNAYREETDFYLQALAAGFRLMYCPHTACYHYRVDRSKDRGGNWVGRPRFRQQWYSVTNNWRFVKKHRRTLSRLSLPSPLVLQAAFVARRGQRAALAFARNFH
jgi:GT2 family glycosyltransferase